MNWTPFKLKWVLRIFTPYRGAGIKVETISKDWKYARVSLRLKILNKNAFGTHFGGSLFSMTDPFYTLLLSNILGKDYYVWDKTGCIDFIKASKKRVYAEFRISEELIQNIKQKTKNGEKYLPKFAVEVLDEEKNIIAKVHKTVYVRRKSNSL